MFLTCRTKQSHLEVLLLIFGVLVALNVESRGQMSKNGEKVLATQRAERDRMLFSTIQKKDSDAKRLATIREAKEDFRDLQTLNYKLMTEAGARDMLDYSLVSEMVSSMREKATRLKVNLKLPEARGSEKRAARTIVNIQEFRSALLILNQAIVRFVTNPIFQTAKTFEVNQAKKATEDLEEVISLTADLKRTASKLARISSPSR